MDAEPPPSYAQATGSSKASNKNSTPSSQSHRNDAPAPYIEPHPEVDERNIPDGWVRRYDAQQAHSYFVDTNADPPRSIWVHPYDDETYLRTLTNEERERIQAEDAARERRMQAKKAKKAEAGVHDDDTTDDEKKHVGAGASSSHAQSSDAGPSNHASSSSQPSGAKKLGRKIADKVTGTTHEQRKAERAKRREEERQAEEAHMAMRAAINRAIQTGQPQMVGKDREGRSVYVEPPPQPGYNYGGYGSCGGYGARAAPNSSNPIYSDPNARFVRPSYGGYGYGRPYGYGGYGGYGGGYGYGYGGLGLPLAGGLLGGALLGGLLF